MAKWYKLPTSSTMSDGDYRAGLNALNIVFGAVLGFVLVGGQDLPLRDFTALLVISAFLVMMIQSIALSEYTLFTIVATGLGIYFLPTIAQDFFAIAKVPKLQPTLAVWAGMAAALELSPREKRAQDTAEHITGETTK